MKPNGDFKLSRQALVSIISNRPNEMCLGPIKSHKQTHPEGSKQPTPAGLYGMTENVCERTLDGHGEHVRQSACDPSGPRTGTQRVIKVGCWMSTERNVCGTV